MTQDDAIRMAHEAGGATAWFGYDATEGMKFFKIECLALFAAEVAAKAAAAERERICAAIKAEDDHCATGDYMLDSDDCIKVARGEWQRPDYSADQQGGAGGVGRLAPDVSLINEGDMPAAPAQPVAEESERKSFIAYLTGTFPKAYSTEDADYLWSHNHVSALAWQRRAALAVQAMLAGAPTPPLTHSGDKP